MTDENVIRLPGSRVDDSDTESTRTERDAHERDQRPASDREEPNPMLKEGPDALDAADIEDPDQQL